MRKEQYEEYKTKHTTVYCECCGQTYPIEGFSYSHMHLNGTASRCNICDWFKRHGEVKIDGWNNEELRKLIQFFIVNTSHILNDFLDVLPNKSLEDVIKTYQKLKIGNKPIDIATKCKCCGETVLKPPNVYLNTKDYYCSLVCYWKDKPNTVGKGKYNIAYNRIATKCTNCGKDIEVIPFDFDKVNKYGDNHNFCSQECYWEYRSKYYVGEKSVALNRKVSDKEREQMRLRLVKTFKNAERLNSKIQLTINDVLDKLNIKYEREYVVKYYAIDNYLIDSNLMIEIMGDYWHTSPIKYNANSHLMSERQAEYIHRDKLKHSYIKNHNDVEILYLWERDIEHNLNMCEELIKHYITHKGVIENYHSFNYDINDDFQLMLNSNIIIPYQDMKVDEYRNLIQYKNIG